MERKEDNNISYVNERVKNRETLDCLSSICLRVVFISLRGSIVCRLLVFVDISSRRFVCFGAIVLILCHAGLSPYFRALLRVIPNDVDFALCRFGAGLHCFITQLFLNRYVSFHRYVCYFGWSGAKCDLMWLLAGWYQNIIYHFLPPQRRITSLVGEFMVCPLCVSLHGFLAYC